MTPVPPRRLQVLLTLALCLALALTALPLVLAPPAAADRTGTPAAEEAALAPYRVVVGMTGVRWTDVDAETTPTLACLAERGDLAAMAVTSETALTTSAQGWESLRTGARGSADAARTTTAGTDADVLGAGLAEVGVGIETLSLTGTPEDGAPDELGLAEDQLTLVDLGSVAPVGSTSAEQRESELAALDDRLAALVAANGGCAGFPAALVASLADVAGPEAPEGARAGVHVLIDTTRSASGEGSESEPAAEDLPGFLRSPSTRQTSLVQLVDLAPTILAAHGAEVPTSLTGSVLQRLPDDGDAAGTRFVPMSSDPIQRALDQTQASAAVDRAVAPILTVWAAVALAALIVVAWPRSRSGPPARLRSVAAGVLLAASTMPAATLLAQWVPWWRFEGRETLTLGATMALLMTVAARLLLLPRFRRSPDLPVGLAAGFVALVLLIEALAGSPMQTSALLGSQPTVSGRFYGISNHYYAWLLAGAVVALSVACRRLARPRSRVALTAVVGLVVTVVCVAPSWGADFGSMLVSVPTFGILLLLLTGRRIKMLHLVGLGLAAAVAVLAVSFLDWLRPPAQRSHLGDFIDTLLSGGLWETITRKLGRNLSFFETVPVLWLALALVIALTVAAVAPLRLRLVPLAALYAQNPALRSGLLALAVGLWIGFVVNDTGIALLGAGAGFLLIWVPLLCPRGEELQGAVPDDALSPRSASAGP